MKNNVERNMSIYIILCFVAFEILFKIIIKAIFADVLSSINASTIVFGIFINIISLILSLKLSTVIVCKYNNKNFSKSNVIRNIIFFNLILTVIFAFYDVFDYKAQFERYEEQKAEFENVNYDKMTKKQKETAMTLRNVSETLNNYLYDYTKQSLVIEVVYIISRFLVVFLLPFFLKENNVTEEITQENTPKQQKDEELTVKSDSSSTNDTTHDYDFLFDKKKTFKKINGAEIAITILGAFSIILSFAMPIIAIILSAIGLLIGKLNITLNSLGIAKVGYMFCKISICLAPSFMLISFILSLFGVMTALSVLSGGIISLFMY